VEEASQENKINSEPQTVAIESNAEKQNSENIVEEMITKRKPRRKNKDRVRISNLLEEIRELLDGCVNCGLCKTACPIFKIARDEELSPRGRVFLLSHGCIDKDAFKCLLCRACEKNCPKKLKICEAIIKAREILCLKRKEPKSNKKLLKELV